MCTHRDGELGEAVEEHVDEREEQDAQVDGAVLQVHPQRRAEEESRRDERHDAALCIATMDGYVNPYFMSFSLPLSRTAIDGSLELK